MRFITTGRGRQFSRSGRFVVEGARCGARVHSRTRTGNIPQTCLIELNALPEKASDTASSVLSGTLKRWK